MTRRGLYEILITELLHEELKDIDPRFTAQRSGLRAAEAGNRIALHLARVIEKAIGDVEDRDRVKTGIALARRLVDVISDASERRELAIQRPVEAGQILDAILAFRPDGTVETIDAPLIPLLDTTLLTNAPGEPRVGSQILAEIHSADRIDVIMAFIRRSGIGPMMEALRRHCDARKPLRVITTTYTGSTEKRALEDLRQLGAEVRVSYDTSSTRLHAKAWLFHRASGFSTAYIGSSNLTHSAQVSGLEWNVRLSAARNPDVIDKVSAIFESYCNNPDFRCYDPGEFDANAAADRDGAAPDLGPLELRPQPFQERLLEQIALAREQGHHRNLLVAATGTGKTVMAALDYAGLHHTLPRSRLLFVAHRQEILETARATYRVALRDPTFGELWVGGHRPRNFEHVFASIQSLREADLALLPPDQFDIVVIDEFHHAAAPSYRRLLEHLNPAELLGLTATPERNDGLEVLSYFDGRIAAELRLWDAIDQHRLTPFVYYGIHDGTDLRAVPWRRGQGYDIEELSNVLTADDMTGRLVLQALRRRVADTSRMRALGFCVSVRHARFMARIFSEQGVRATAIWADTPEHERRDALKALSNGDTDVLFSVDLFNEGIDVPGIDTLLMLRPTESPTLFLQQLGRGLRRQPGKDVCTVLDFVGNHRREFRYDRRLQALLGGTRRDVEAQVARGFPFLPAGCHMELDQVATRIVLDSIRNAIPDTWTTRVDLLRTLTADGRDCGLQRYLDESGLEPAELYANNRGWSNLRAAAGIGVPARDAPETAIRNAVGRMFHVDDPRRLAAYRAFVATDTPPDLGTLSPQDQRLFRMLMTSLVGARGLVKKDASVADGAELLWRCPAVISELREVFALLNKRIGHVTPPLAGFDAPLSIHARYTRQEILAAFNVGSGCRTPSWREGVKWIPQERADVFVFTLDKSSGGFSPTTRYRDYAVSPSLIHWESQSTTTADSPTGRRYRNHMQTGSSIMMFARLRSDDRAFHFLGPAEYQKHEGEQPMAITWKLRHPLPGDLFAAFAAAVA